MEKVIVAVRIRPQNIQEQNRGEPCIWLTDIKDGKTLSITPSCLCDFIEEGILTPNSQIHFTFGTF